MSHHLFLPRNFFLKKRLLFTFVSIAFSNPATACEPCHPDAMMTLAETVKKADLILIGKRHNPPFFNDNEGNNGPASIEIKVERVLKGSLEQKSIEAASWYGMCGYGVILHKERALLLLRKGPRNYEVVNPVCGNNQFILINDKLTNRTMRGKEVVHEPIMSLEEFIEKHL